MKILVSGHNRRNLHFQVEDDHGAILDVDIPRPTLDQVQADLELAQQPTQAQIESWIASKLAQAVGETTGANRIIAQATASMTGRTMQLAASAGSIGSTGALPVP